MKFAVISDTHGNLLALDAVLADARAQGAEGWIFAGDYCMSLPWPEETAVRIRSLPGAVVVRGNEEAYTEPLQGKTLSDCESGQMEISYWCAGQLSDASAEFLRSLPQSAAFTQNGISLKVCHSSTEFIGDAEHREFSTSKIYLSHRQGTSHRALLEEIRTSLAGNEDFAARARALDPGVYIFGHSHCQWFAEFEGRIFLNPGSCGLPLDYCEEGAPYSLLELENGRARVLERRVAYDRAAVGQALTTGRQGQEVPVWSGVLFREIRERREYIHFFLKFTEAYARRIGDTVRPFSKETWQAAYRAWEQSL